jgi:hypothetical protein
MTGHTRDVNTRYVNVVVWNSAHVRCAVVAGDGVGCSYLLQSGLVGKFRSSVVHCMCGTYSCIWREVGGSRCLVIRYLCARVLYTVVLTPLFGERLYVGLLKCG